MLRVGVVHDGNVVAGWQGRCVEHLLRLEDVETVLLDRGPAGLRARASRDRPRPGRRPAFADIAHVGDLGLDVILGLSVAGGAGLPETAARYGVWSFHHGDDLGYSRAPLTRWEPHCARLAFHVALIGVDGQGSRGVVLQEGCFTTRRASWHRSLGAILATVAEWPAKVCRETLLLGNDLAGRRREVRWRPGTSAAPAAAVRTWLHRCLSEVRRGLVRHRKRWYREVWAIGIADAPIHAFLDPARGCRLAWLAEGAPGEFLADPFGWPSPDGRTILAERYDGRRRLGTLCAIEADADGGGAHRRPVLPLPVHVSYPYLFESDGAIYCVPETFQSRGVHLFQAERYPMEWRFVTTLIEDFAAVDPTIVRHGGRFWLFCGCLDEVPHTNLYLWSADDLVGPWVPHPRNPVKCDVRSARPAGTPFEHEGVLYRPGQDCSETYGGAVTVNRVLTLTRRDFEEEAVLTVRPDPIGPYPAGLHTLSAFGSHTLIDGKRLGWRWPWGPRGPALHPDAAMLPGVLEDLRAGGRRERTAAQTPNSAVRIRP